MSVITHLCLAVFSFPVVCFSFLSFIFSHSDHTKHVVVLLGLAQLVWHPTGWSFESATFWFHHYFSALLVWWTSYRTHDQWQISNVTWDAMQVSCDTRFLKPLSLSTKWTKQIDPPLTIFENLILLFRQHPGLWYKSQKVVQISITAFQNSRKRMSQD